MNYLANFSLVPGKITLLFTLHPMVLFMTKITEALENKQHTLAIFCDLRKGFDSCNHKIVLTKLRNMGIQGTELNWFKDYLYNRKQYVFLNGTATVVPS